jgi:hypothetical protein
MKRGHTIVVDEAMKKKEEGCGDSPYSNARE